MRTRLSWALLLWRQGKEEAAEEAPSLGPEQGQAEPECLEAMLGGRAGTLGGRLPWHLVSEFHSKSLWRAEGVSPMDGRGLG